jgi:hypothetical protein
LHGLWLYRIICNYVNIIWLGISTRISTVHGSSNSTLPATWCSALCCLYSLSWYLSSPPPHFFCPHSLVRETSLSRQELRQNTSRLLSDLLHAYKINRRPKKWYFWPQIGQTWKNALKRPKIIFFCKKLSCLIIIIHLNT